MINLEKLKQAREAATPGPWDRSNVGFVHKNGVMHPRRPCEDRLDGESWLDMRNRLEPEFRKRDAECAANSDITAMAPDLADAVIELAEALRWMIDHVEGEAFARGAGDTEPADYAPAVDQARAAFAKHIKGERT